MKKFHHIGIPTDKQRDGEIYSPDLKLHYDTGGDNPYGVLWIRYDDDGDHPETVRNQTYVAFEVDDIEDAIKNEKVISHAKDVMPGLKSAVIEVLGAPVKFLQINKEAAGQGFATNLVESSGKTLIYHHTGIPSDGAWEDEIKVPHLKLAYLPGKYNNYGVEWLRFEEGNENPDIIKYIPHVAFEVDDIDQAIVGEKVIYHSGRETPGIIVAMIEVNGISIEFLELDRSIVGDQYDSGQ